MLQSQHREGDLLSAAGKEATEAGLRGRYGLPVEEQGNRQRGSPKEENRHMQSNYFLYNVIHQFSYYTIPLLTILPFLLEMGS